MEKSRSMLTVKEKKTVLEKIIQSEAFHHSQVYQDLLTYLVEASIHETTPKEYTIATDVFNKDTDFDPSHDTIVRVYIYNLRKKLDQYYSREGQNDPIRIELPKGHYEINFTRNLKSKQSGRTGKHLGLGLLLALSAVNVLLLIGNLRFRNNGQESGMYRNDPIWKDFLSDDGPKQLILGDHFFFVKDDNDLVNRTILRKDDINSLEELEEYKGRDIQRRNYIQMRFPMFPRNSVWPMVDILTLMIRSGQDFKLDFASNVRAGDIKQNDIIFIGSFHTLFAFDQTFRNSKYSFEIYPNRISYLDKQTDSLVTYSAEADPIYYHTDFGVIRKIPGPQKNNVLMFCSFHETGTIGIVKYVTQPDSLRSLESALIRETGHVPDYFEILFKATGYDRTTYTTTLLDIREINPAMRFW